MNSAGRGGGERQFTLVEAEADSVNLTDGLFFIANIPRFDRVRRCTFKFSSSPSFFMRFASFADVCNAKNPSLSRFRLTLA
jgi:hypothetical protein